MGAWGTAIFSDDLACDVRDTYKEYLGDGLTGQEATDRLLDEYSDVLDDSEEGNVLWLALAATQWKCGRLEDRIKSKVIEIIDNGYDLERWQDNPKDLKKREVALRKIYEQLNSPQCEPKRISKVFKDSSEFSIGDAFSYMLKSGKLVVFKVVDFHTDRGGTSPICQLCDWVGEQAPDSNTIKKLGLKHWHSRTEVMLAGVKKNEYPAQRIKFLAHDVAKAKQCNGGYYLYLWRNLDEALERDFALV